MKSALSTFCALLLCAVTASSVSAEMVAQSAKVKAPYVITVPPSATVTSAFLVLTNSGDKKITVTKVVSDVSRSAEIHTHIHADGMMKMEHVPTLDIEPHETVTFEPGSYHVMLIGLKKSLKDGDTVQLTFSFQDGSTVTVNTPVRDIRKMHGHEMEKPQGMSHGGMHHQESSHDMHHGHSEE